MDVSKLPCTYQLFLEEEMKLELIKRGWSVQFVRDLRVIGYFDPPWEEK